MADKQLRGRLVPDHGSGPEHVTTGIADKLIERLLATRIIKTCDGGENMLINPDGPEAAQAITALTAELQELRLELITAHGQNQTALEEKAEVTAERDAFREALTAVSTLDYPRPIGTQYMPDRASKHDKCTHGVWMYDDCGNCISDYAAATLKGDPANERQRQNG